METQSTVQPSSNPNLVPKHESGGLFPGANDQEQQVETTMNMNEARNGEVSKNKFNETAERKGGETGELGTE